MAVRKSKLGYVREEDPLTSSHTPLVFLINPCNFVSFQPARKSLPYSVEEPRIFHSSYYFTPFTTKPSILCTIKSSYCGHAYLHGPCTLSKSEIGLVTNIDGKA